MALYPLVFTPDPVLRQAAKPLTQDDFNDDLQTLINDMFDTMYHSKGVGLAAPQIGISKQLAVIDATKDKSQQLVLINPTITHQADMIKMQEGCLSVPGAYDTVKRYNIATLQALDRHGKEYEITGEGLLAEAIQHEVDHLKGRLFIDLLSPLKRQMAKRKCEKFKRQIEQGD